jgi:hypothetical protein
MRRREPRDQRVPEWYQARRSPDLQLEFAVDRLSLGLDSNRAVTLVVAVIAPSPYGGRMTR